MSKIYPLKSNPADHLPTPKELRDELPAAQAHLDFVHKKRQEIRDILDCRQERLLVIAGPCSIHDTSAALEYAEKLNNLAKLVSDSILIVMRVYFEKPRTHLGWKGMLYDPHLDGSHAIHTGLRLTRKLLIDIADLPIPAAAEFLDPSSAQYFGDLVSWGCIGARTAESQTHRQMASGLPMPIAFKNGTSGNVEPAINGILAASSPQTFIGLNPEGRISVVHTEGNTYGHIALRGGEFKPNYDPASIDSTLTSLEKAGLPKRVIVDCSHDNSGRKHEQQPTVFHSVMDQILEGNRWIRGLILESHLHAGNQAIPDHPSKLRYAVSLTDPCMDWIATEKLILQAHHTLKERTERIKEREDDALCTAKLGAGK